MSKRIVYKNQDSVVVLIPNLNCGLSLEEIIAKDVPSNVSHSVVDVADIPQDRTFRNAWDMASGNVRIDMGKAKLVAHEHRRKARDEKFKPLDIEATIPGKQVEAEAKRQVIRDEDAILQLDIDNATSAEELKELLSL